MFPVKRDVVQGDITSPIYFVLALELIMRLHDTRTDKGVDMCGKTIHSLGYADDITLVDTSLETATSRVTDISKGTKRDADMEINVTETEEMHVCEQEAVSTTTAAQAKKVCRHKVQKSGLQQSLLQCPRSKVSPRKMQVEEHLCVGQNHGGGGDHGRLEVQGALARVRTG